MQNEQDKLKQDQNVPEEEIKTITPTMLDEEEIAHASSGHKDLSAIIPEYNNEISRKEVSFNSKDNELKSDGSVILATFNTENLEEDPVLDSDAAIPEQINIEERKIEIARNKNKKRKKIEKKKKRSEAERKIARGQNIICLISLTIIIGIVAFVYYYKERPLDSKFKVLEVQVEIGDRLPIRKENYVKPGIGTRIDELTYSINTEKVVVDAIGEYEYTVTHNGITKPGIIKIVDTKAPTLIVREVVITEGMTYTPASFVQECQDYSGCNYSYEDPETPNKYKEPGEYIIYIVAIDAYQNKAVKQASLKIEATGMVKHFVKKELFDFEKGYEKTTEYELHFTDFASTAIILNGKQIITYKYNDEDLYRKDKGEYYGFETYTFDDDSKTITKKDTISSVGNNYTRLNNVIDYLTGQGYIDE